MIGTDLLLLGAGVAGDNAAIQGLSFIVLFAAVAAIGLGVYVAVDKNDAEPNSP